MTELDTTRSRQLEKSVKGLEAKLETYEANQAQLAQNMKELQ